MKKATRNYEQLYVNALGKTDERNKSLGKTQIMNMTQVDAESVWICTKQSNW